MGKTDKYVCPQNYLPFDSIAKSLRYATAVTMLGLKLRESPNYANIHFDDIKDLAASSLNPGDYLEKELLALIDKCKEIYHEKRKKREK